MAIRSKVVLAGLSSLALFGLSGCGTSLFTSPKENPVIEDTLGYFNTGPISALVTTPERQIFLVSMREGRVGLFCAEPSADVAESLSSSFQAALERKIPNANAAGAGEIGRALSTAVQALAQRSQGLQLCRDIGYRLCEMYLNDVLTPAEYRESMTVLATKAFELVKLELERNDGKIGYGPVPPLSAPELQKLESLARFLDSELPVQPASDASSASGAAGSETPG